MIRILGIDPGSRCTGYGIIAMQGQSATWIHHGQIHTTGDDLVHRLQQIYQDIKEIINQYQPQQVAVERVFVGKNIQSALKLGHARGAAIVAAGSHSLSVNEYSPRQVKQAIVGYGAASKIQVQMMVRSLLKLKENPATDAADALAIALCHGFSYPIISRLNQAKTKSQQLAEPVQ